METTENQNSPQAKDIEIFFDFIRQPKKVIKEWAGNPPHGLGLLVLFLVCLELVLNNRLMNDTGTGPSAIRQFFFYLFIILLGEALIISTSHKIGRLFYKKGNPGHVWTWFNLSLWPLLVLLPVGLITWTSGQSAFFNSLLMLLLAGKIVTDWKIIIDRHYQFNRWQSALILMALLGLFYAVLPIVFLFGFMETIGDLISMLR